MQDPREPSSDEISNPKQRKKKISSQRVASLQFQGTEIKEIQNVLGALPLGMGQKASKRNLKNGASPLFQQPERSNSDSLQDSTTSDNEYRVLRRKYLLLEEESFALGKELRGVEDEVKTLEDEKLTLLDQLVVLEGLVDPSDMQFQEGPQYA